MPKLSRAQLKNLIKGQDEPNHFISNLIDSFLNREDDIWAGTKAEYDALSSYNPDVLYLITE